MMSKRCCIRLSSPACAGRATKNPSPRLSEMGSFGSLVYEQSWSYATSDGDGHDHQQTMTTRRVMDQESPAHRAVSSEVIRNEAVSGEQSREGRGIWPCRTN